jgi:hypothetical protein
MCGGFEVPAMPVHPRVGIVVAPPDPAPMQKPAAQLFENLVREAKDEHPGARLPENLGGNASLGQKTR